MPFDRKVCENRATAVGRPGVQRFKSSWRKRRGSVQHVQNLPDRPVRVPVPDLRPAAVFTSRWPSRAAHNDCTPQRYRERARKLIPAQQSAIRALAGTKSLRELAADFGVSHETIRSALREGTAAAIV